MIFTKNEISIGITIKFHRISKNIPKSKKVLNLLLGFITGIYLISSFNLKNNLYIVCFKVISFNLYKKILNKKIFLINIKKIKIYSFTKSFIYILLF